MSILILSLLAIILCVIAYITEIKSRKLQQEILREMIDFCNKLSEEKTKLMERICNQDEKLKSRNKFISIITKQLNKERVKRKDIENNLEFITNNIEDEKLKELVQTSKQN